ncbi:hypothetical protein PR003_g564 [Phytophthora rubi]|uniref:Reverse transcriptase RNase H-like domain-containing protein n=1 Tax=Phytophthora rubi TaxID=129364 RepID=A0A6A3JMA7_9STRA|nr:hypothetical protein PR002_g20430 [Phytophthora rubi]KAE9359836.1 hypothetical protein PR003_g564 [Phytophthora rubi]
MNVVADALSRAPAAVKAVTGRERVGERRAPAATIADEDGKTEDDEPVYCTLALPTTSEDGKKRLVGSESTLPPPVAMATTSAKVGAHQEDANQTRTPVLARGPLTRSAKRRLDAAAAAVSPVEPRHREEM